MQVLLCTDAITQGPDGPVCSGDLVLSQTDTFSVSIDNLTLVLNTLFAFDPWIFGTVLFTLALSFVNGWGAGVVARLLSSQ